MVRHLAYGRTHLQLREHLLAGDTPGPICGSPVFRHPLMDLRDTDAAGR